MEPRKNTEQAVSVLYKNEPHNKHGFLNMLDFVGVMSTWSSVLSPINHKIYVKRHYNSFMICMRFSVPYYIQEMNRDTQERSIQHEDPSQDKRQSKLQHHFSP
jgi:hypothetical protein